MATATLTTTTPFVGYVEWGGAKHQRVENGSAYRTPAKTSEEVLEENIREELSRFNKYVSPLNQDSYKQDVLQALKKH